MTTGYRHEADLPSVGESILEHPFCVHWATGDLAAADLANFATEFEHAVCAIARAAAQAAVLDPAAAGVAAEELRQVSCWRAFSRTVGWGGMAAWTYGEEPLPETEECARVWAGDPGRTLSEQRRALQAIDAIQGPVCEVMLSGLIRHYGFEDGDATEYFRLHAGLPGGLPSAHDDDINRSFWHLLDGVEGLNRR